MDVSFSGGRAGGVRALGAWGSRRWGKALARSLNSPLLVAVGSRVFRRGE